MLIKVKSLVLIGAAKFAYVSLDSVISLVSLVRGSVDNHVFIISLEALLG